MNYFPIQGNGHSLGGIQNPFDIPGRHFAALDRNHAVAVEPGNMTSRNTCVYRTDLTSSHEFGFFQGLFDGLHGLLDIHDHTLAQSRGRTCPYPHNINSAGSDFSHHGTDLCGSDIQSYYKFRLGHNSFLG